MEISCIPPLTRAWQRTRTLLFRPFRIETWLVVGLAAFLTDVLASGALGGGSWSSGGGWPMSGAGTGNWLEHLPKITLGNVIEALRERTLELLQNTTFLLLIGGTLLAFILVAIALTWVGARARFVFLHAVATGRAEFLEPWKRYGRLGTSLFLWEACFSFAYLLPAACVVWPLWNTVAQILRSRELTWPAWGPIVAGGLGAAVLVLALGAVRRVLHEFVVPLMYRHDERAGQAWARLWPLLRGHPGAFVVYLVFFCVLQLAVGVVLGIVGVGTCCLASMILGSPFIGSVLLLPITMTARALGPEYLAQFGSEWTTLSAIVPAAPAPTAPPVPPRVVT